MTESDQMDQRLRRGLEQLAEEAPVGPPEMTAAIAPQPTGGPSHQRWRLLVPLSAAAAVVSILGGVALLVDDSPTPRPDRDTGAAAGVADPSVTTPSSDPGLASADEVRGVADPLAALYAEPGFGRVQMDIPGQRVIVWWKGTPPEQVQQAEGPHDSGVTVEVRSAAHSDAELDAASQKVSDYARTHDIAVYMTVKNKDMSGLVASIDAEPGAIDLDSVAAELSTAAGVPVTVVLGEGIDFQ